MRIFCITTVASSNSGRTCSATAAFVKRLENKVDGLHDRLLCEKQACPFLQSPWNAAPTTSLGVGIAIEPTKNSRHLILHLAASATTNWVLRVSMSHLFLRFDTFRPFRQTVATRRAHKLHSQSFPVRVDTGALDCTKVHAQARRKRCGQGSDLNPRHYSINNTI